MYFTPFYFITCKASFSFCVFSLYALQSQGLLLALDVQKNELHHRHTGTHVSFLDSSSAV